MSRQLLNTWTIYLLIVIYLTNLSFANPVVPELKETPKTTLDVVLQKCPRLDNIKLDQNLVDILNKTCADWQAINSTTSVPKEGDINAQCLILYESFVTFCSSFGDLLLPKHLNLILFAKTQPSTIQQICSKNLSLYSLKDTEHNISGILDPGTQPIDCIFLCSYYEKGAPIVYDICKYSYFFATFNVKGLLEHENALTEINNLPAQNKNNQTQHVEANVQANVKPNVLNNETVEIKISKPNQTETHAHEELSKGTNDGKKDAANEPKNIQPNVQLPGQNLKPNNEEKILPDEEPVPVAKNPLEIVKDYKPDFTTIKELNKKDDDKKQANVAVENIIENNKSLEANNDNQDEFEDEEAEAQDQGDANNNGKAEPVMPEETGEVKPPMKGKSNTIEDEPASSYNIPEDDMDGDSYFFSYFTVLMCLVIVGYVGYHNRQKILALLLEGKRGKRCGRQTRRPNSSNYHKLDSNLEEAISSSCTKNASNVIY